MTPSLLASLLRNSGPGSGRNCSRKPRLTVLITWLCLCSSSCLEPWIAWQRRFPRSSTAGYLRDGLQRGFDALAELGVTFSDGAKAALAWESLRGAEREALEGKVANIPAEGKAEGKAEEGKAEEGQADDVKTKLVKESFDLLRQSFEGQGGDPFDVVREQPLFQPRLGVLMDGSPLLFESISARRTSGTTKSRSGKFWSKHPRAPLQQGSSRLQPPSVGKDSTSQPCRHCGKSGHRPWKCDQHPRQQRKQRRSNPPAISFRTDGVRPPPSSQQRPATPTCQQQAKLHDPQAVRLDEKEAPAERDPRGGMFSCRGNARSDFLCGQGPTNNAPRFRGTFLDSATP